MFTRVLNVLDASQGCSRIDKVRVMLNELGPLSILRHGNWSRTEPLNRVVGLISVALQDTGQRAVSLLDLANYDGLQFPAGALEIEVGLPK